MRSGTMSKSLLAVLGGVFLVSLCIYPPKVNAQAVSEMFKDGSDLNQCGDNEDFTSDFRLQDCRFIPWGSNPFFSLRPGYRVVLETPEGVEDRERSIETVLYETKLIKLGGRKILTRVVEERAFEWDEDEGEWVAIEISLNYFAICRKTNAVYYFGEWSRDCPEGFDEDDVCEGDESNEGSWEAGVNRAKPGVMMPGTILLGAKYFQEIAPKDGAVDRGEIISMGWDWENPEYDLKWSGCIEIRDTNPAEEDGCGDDDLKMYCPGVGLVQDQDLRLVWRGWVGPEPDDNDAD